MAELLLWVVVVRVRVTGVQKWVRLKGGGPTYCEGSSIIAQRRIGPG